jgi:uncharacterized iron-regulated protein
MFHGETGEAIGWPELMDAVMWADVIFLGEQHDDGVGHAVERAVVEDAVLTDPRTAVSLEMLERHEQHIVDDYLAGLIEQHEFIEDTGSANWGAPGRWIDWYQPVIDAAKDAGARVVAANAPRHYVRLASQEGYERLDSLTGAQRALFTHPRRPHESGGYRERFFALMSQPMGDDPEGAHGRGMTDEEILPIFRSQLVWDATMAQSIARALDEGDATRVIHLVGAFHIEYDGGTVIELRRRKPLARILTVSLTRADARALREEDRGRADVIIYTGEPPPEPQPVEEEAPAEAAEPPVNDAVNETQPGEGDPESPPTADDHPRTR